MDQDELLKKFEQNGAIIEKLIGIRMLHVYQCIYCGRMFDLPNDALYHRQVCKLKDVKKEHEMV